MRCLALDVRFGSKADIWATVRNVRFTPKSGHSARRRQCPLSANSGHRDLHDRDHGRAQMGFVWAQLPGR